MKIVQYTFSETKALLPPAEQQSNVDNYFPLPPAKNPNSLKILCCKHDKKSGVQSEYNPAHFKGAKIKGVMAWTLN